METLFFFVIFNQLSELVLRNPSRNEAVLCSSCHVMLVLFFFFFLTFIFPWCIPLKSLPKTLNNTYKFALKTDSSARYSQTFSVSLTYTERENTIAIIDTV